MQEKELIQNQPWDFYKAPEKVGLSRWLSGKEPACNGGDTEFNPWFTVWTGGAGVKQGKEPGGGHGNRLQYFRLVNPMD